MHKDLHWYAYYSSVTCVIGADAYAWGHSIVPGVLSFFLNALLGGHRTELNQTLHMFGREPGMKIVIQNLGTLSPYNVGPANCLFSDVLWRLRDLSDNTFWRHQNIENG